MSGPWWCPDCRRRVYGLGEHFSDNGICETSSPMDGGGELSSDGAPLGERGSLGDPPSPLGEPDVSRNDTSGSVPPRTGGEV